jgi:asparagine synthase (glutamine-hydrolysing)
MCGIVGVIDSTRPRDGSVLAGVRRGVEVMAHRGPDDHFSDELDGRGAWGMCRLAIRDPAQGRQPFWRDDVGVIFNGEIYNTDELRRTLHRRGHKFSTSCDTEVVLAGYLEFGSAVFGLFDGIFAVAIVDQPNNRFVLARDEFGVKPLFVRSTDGSVAFASEPKALRELGALSDGPDLAAIHAYLRHQFVPEPDSPWRNVRRVPRGTAEIYSLDEVRRVGVEHFQQPPTDLGDGDWLEATRAAVDLSVRRQLVSDRPLGVFLSGGVDSTLVSATASDAHPGIRAFGISVPGWARDERRYMEEAARHLDIDLVITELRESDFERLLDQLLDVYDEPFADYSAIPTMLVSEVAANDLRVVLTGDGGDELFGGYGRYGAAFHLQAAGFVPGSLSALVGRVLGRVPRYGPTAERLLDQTRDEVLNGGYGYGSMLAIQREASVDALLGGRTVPPRPIVAATRRSRPWDRLDALDVAMAVDTEQYLPADILTKVDRASMAVSLEARVPLLGAPVARLAARMPVEVKVRGGVGKWPLKELLRQRGFADAFVDRTKSGFSFPVAEWLVRAVGNRPDYLDLFRAPPPPLDPVVTGALLDSLLAGEDVGHISWCVLVLSAWLTRNS